MLTKATVHDAAQLLLQMDENEPEPGEAVAVGTGTAEACEDSPDNYVGKGKGRAVLKPSVGINPETPKSSEPVAISQQLQDTGPSTTVASSSKAVLLDEDEGYQERKRELLKETASALKKQKNDAKEQRQQILDKIEEDRKRRRQKPSRGESSHQDTPSRPRITDLDKKEGQKEHREAKLRLQTPDMVFHRTFLAHHTLAEVAAFVNQEAGIVTARFETALPLRQVFLPDSFHRTLDEAGMVPSAAVRVVPAAPEPQVVSA